MAKYFFSGDDEYQTKLFMMLFCQIFIPTLSLFLCLRAAREKPFFTDLLGLSIFLPFVIVSYIFHIVPSLKIDTEDGPTYLFKLTCLFYLTNCQFMSTNFLVSVVTREVCTWSCLALQIMKSNDGNLGLSLLVFNGFNLFLVVFVESATYSSMRSKALLF